MEPFELERFPFDTQHLGFDIILRTDLNFQDITDENNNALSLVWMEEWSLFSFNAKAPFGWRLMGTQIQSKMGERYGRQPQLTQTHCIVLQREWKFYLRNVIFVLFIVSLITLGVFTFGDDTAADRLGFVSGMFLTAVAYMFIVNEYLPQTNYWTLLDQYVYFVVLLMFVVSVQVCILNRMMEHDQSIDDLMLWIDVILWFMVHVYFVSYSVYSYKKEQKKVNMSKEEIDAHSNSNNKFIRIDQKSTATESDKYRRYWSSE